MPLTPRFDFPVTSSFPPWRASSAPDDDHSPEPPPTPACGVDPGPHQIFEHLRCSNIEALKAALAAVSPGKLTRGLAACAREDTNQYVAKQEHFTNLPICKHFLRSYSWLQIYPSHGCCL
jgi:hypothetical protein